MAEIIINLSACYEDVGWEGSYVSTGIASDWIKKISDVRNPMSDNNLHAEEAYSISVNECGTFYNKIVPNKADSRGGFIQVSVIVPAGYRALHADQVLFTISQVFAALPKELSDQEAFFEKNQEQLIAFKDKIAHLPSGVALEKDYVFADASSEISQSAKAAYHFINDEKELEEWFQYPHQDEHEGYKTVYFISKEVEPGTSAVALASTKPQIVYTINNQGEIFYIKEGTSFDLPLRSHMDMEPKVYTVKADGQNDKNGVYVVENSTIYVYEGKVGFHRQVILQVQCPVSEKKADHITRPTLTLCVNNKAIKTLEPTLANEGSYPQVFTYSFDYELENEGRYTFELEKNSSLKFDNSNLNINNITGQWNASFEFKTRLMRIYLRYKDKNISTNDIKCPKIEVKDCFTNNQLKVHESSSDYWEYKCEAGKNYTVNLNCKGTPYQPIKEVPEFSISQEEPVVNIDLKNKPKPIYVRLVDKDADEVTLLTTTTDLDAEAKKYYGYSVEKKLDRKLHNETYDEAYRLKIVPAKYKSLFIIASIFAILFITSTIALGIILLRNNNQTESVQEVTSTQTKFQEDKQSYSTTDSVSTNKDSLQLNKDSLAAEIPIVPKSAEN